MPDGFHPAVRDWFLRRFGAPTPPQEKAWPAIAARHPVLVAAPTGSGKTLAAFLGAIDGLVRAGLEGELPDETRVLYVSPLKALSTDVAKNLEIPLRGISETLEGLGLTPPLVRTAVRTGDTSPKERAAATKKPPHIQVTTPESLYVLLTSEGGRRMLSTVRLVIVDEIHALVSDKRGAHLALSLERLDALVTEATGSPAQRVGLSATQKPIEEVARFLLGQKPGPPCVIVDQGHTRALDLSLCVPRSPLEPVLPLEIWEEVYDQLAELIRAHKTTLVFTNTRRLSERVTRHLAERLGEEDVTSHHGSLSHALRKDAEDRLKAGKLRALVATASLELGIDVGDVDLVCQLGSPGSIATFLQRVGRSGHFVGGTPKGRLFPLSQSDLVECTALLDAVSHGELDEIRIPEAPLDILAQQLVASVVPEPLELDALFARVTAAYPYRNLSREDFDAVVAMLAEGFTTARGRRGAYLHLDLVDKKVTARRNARLTALTSGGAIPDNFDYDVVLTPTDVRVGSVHEDFAIESMVGDIFQLGNTSYQILRTEPGVLRVADAHGAPPNIPFWIGEAPARTPELSVAVSRLRAWIDEHRDDPGAPRELEARLRLPDGAAEQLFAYLLATRNALGVMPTQARIVAERFFDETGGMHVVIHAPFGSRFTRAFGLALRKRFCRSFNVELQAAADEDALVLSLGPMHSFPLETLFQYLSSKSAQDVLVQALLDAPLFQTRWRWNASRALAIPRFRGGKKVPPRFQRMESDDLLALCFPDQVACLENIAGDREIPDHPLVRQTIEDSLREAMDVDELLRVLRGIEDGSIACFARDLKEPSPLASEILNARPYAFLDDAPLEERRTQAVQRRRFSEASQVDDLGQLDPAAIEQIQLEAWPDPRTPEELHDALTIHGVFTDEEGAALEKAAEVPLLEPLAARGRAARFVIAGLETTGEFATTDGDAGTGGVEKASGGAGTSGARGAELVLWCSVERSHELLLVHPTARALSPLAPFPTSKSAPSDREAALVALVRGRLEMAGPLTAREGSAALGVSEGDVEQALLALEAEGFVLRGRFRPRGEEEFCERRLLARIHRVTLNRLRREVEPVSPAVFVDFITHWQGLQPETRRSGLEGTMAAIEQLQGFSAAASAWESSILPARVAHYEPSWLDTLCLTGRVLWRASSRSGAGPVKNTPIRLLPREEEDLWRPDAETEGASPWGADARRVFEVLERQGACFFGDLTRQSQLLPSQVEQALKELVARGAVTTDSFAGLRTLITPADKRRDLRRGPRGRGGGITLGLAAAGRISALPVPPRGEESSPASEAERLTEIARVLVRRWGVVFRKLLEREVELPPWRDLLRVLYRLEGRGELRGGRFVNGFSGEQFASPEAIPLLRKLRRSGPSSTPVRVSGVDPLNLLGILTPDARVASLASTRLLLVGGVYAAALEGGAPRVLTRPEGWSDARLAAALRLPHAPSSGAPEPWAGSAAARSAGALASSESHPR